MPTSDVQRMHQDEWLSALRSGHYSQHIGAYFADGQGDERRACAMGVVLSLAGVFESSDQWSLCERNWLGISGSLADLIVIKNDEVGLSFDAIADWFKEQRDLWDGDLSDWKP